MQRWSRTTEWVCGLLSGVALFSIMALTFFDVIGRKLISQSIPGALEITELLMAVVIFGALPAVSRRAEHVEFDSLDPFLSHVIRQLQKVGVNLISGMLLLALAWLMWQTGTEFVESGEITAQLKILKAPFIYGMSILCAIAGVMHFVLITAKDNPTTDTEATAL